MLEDLDTMARTVFGEARGEIFSGQIAVAHVIRNRAMRPERFGQSIKDVCLRPKQFSCWNAGDPNRERITSVGLEEPGFLRAYAIAGLVILGNLPDPTLGADHYHEISIHPSWASSMRQTAHIGHHVFYREVG